MSESMVRAFNDARGCFFSTAQAQRAQAEEPGAGHWLFLDLPTELRDEIYSLLFIEPERLLRQHRPTCRFVENRNLGTAVPAWSPLRRCNCVRRRNTGLLLVSRPVHADAARAFWGLNVFSFNGAAQFVREVGLGLPPERRCFIRHVIIYDKRQADSTKDDNAMVDRRWSLEGTAADRVWEVIFSCDSLETLQIRPALFMW